MNRRRVLGVLLVVVAAVAVAAGYWFLYPPQQVTVEVAYGRESAGKTVAVFFDGGHVGEFVVPGNQSCNMAMIPCVETLGNASLTRGSHTVRATVNGTTVLERGFVVNGRAYAWVSVFWDDHADFDIADNPPLWM